MDTPDMKTLKRLADTCRKSGIRSFKGYGIEFTLDEALAPQRRERKPSKAVPQALKDAEAANFQAVELSPMDLLFYSATSQALPKEEGNDS